MKIRYLLAFIGGLLVTLILALGLRMVAPLPVAAADTLLISAAASLQDALKAIDPTFTQASGAAVSYNFGSSGTLQQQIEQGAPADIFFSAATRQMDALQQKGLILTDTRRNLLTNHLVLITPSNSTLSLTSFRQLTESNVKKIAVGEPRSVPAGQYAEELFTNLGILTQVRSKLVYGNSVRNVLAAVESGNADAGIVYTTDALISTQVKQVATAPDNLHSPIIYPIAVLKSSKNPQAARTYLQFLSGSQAKAVFQRYGFGIAG
jgi:molybdate transport system substrate-binding protein